MNKRTYGRKKTTVVHYVVEPSDEDAIRSEDDFSNVAAAERDERIASAIAYCEKLDSLRLSKNPYHVYERTITVRRVAR